MIFDDFFVELTVNAFVLFVQLNISHVPFNLYGIIIRILIESTTASSSLCTSIEVTIDEVLFRLLKIRKA